MNEQPLDYQELPPSEMRERAAAYYRELSRRRSVREFSDRPVPAGVLEDCVRTAGSAPSGANLQPWHFCVVRDASTKREIRTRAEAEERAFYGGRAPQVWLDALAPLGTGAEKPFLESAPALIAVFQKSVVELPSGEVQKTYYPKESTGIATGFLIAALHHAGLATLTHTPSPMAFLNRILGRPPEEKPFLLLVAGFPAPGCRVPAVGRRPLEQIATFHG
jgi:nitroreductase